ncbi:hypothetical protein J4427_00610 [Candidatus Woesearchaeota archaeon]|nr:hypothetical protein [Candidatus Woesearchaeota archaeon]
MAKQKLTSLEQGLLRIGLYNDIANSFKRTKDLREYTTLQRILTKEVYMDHLNALPAREREELTEEEHKQMYDDILETVMLSREKAYDSAVEVVGKRQKAVEEDYKINKQDVIKKVISAINNDLKKAKNPAEAGDALADYFRNVVEIPEIDQAEADRYAKREMEETTGMTVFRAHGNPEKYRKRELRLIALQYIKENKEDEKVVGYSIDENKLAKELDETKEGGILKAATIYFNALRIKEDKKREVAKKAEVDKK